MGEDREHCLNNLFLLSVDDYTPTHQCSCAELVEDARIFAMFHALLGLRALREPATCMKRLNSKGRGVFRKLLRN